MAKTAEPKTVKVTETLKCILTTQEVTEAAQALARHVGESRSLEQEKKSVTDGFKAKIAEAEAKIMQQEALVRDGYEYRKVECDRIYDYEAATVTLVRKDTGEQAEIRKMRADERQAEMDFDE